jgi:YidC/Oxa1 family membrane protein insertase
MSVLVRLALVPLTIRLAVRARRRARALAGMQPQLARLRERWADDPDRLTRATVALYRSRGLSPADPFAMAGALVQLPLYTAFYKAIRRALEAAGGAGFLWIRDLTRPSPLLALAVGGLVFVGTLGTPVPDAPHAMWLRLLPAVGTGVVLLFVSSGFGLYVLGSTGVSALQAGLVRLHERRHPAS